MERVVIFIGTDDLSKLLGVPGQTNHPLALEAAEKVLAGGRKAEKAIGEVVRAGETPNQNANKGYRQLSNTVSGPRAAAGKQLVASLKA